jgi:hypothetical protein
MTYFLNLSVPEPIHKKAKRRRRRMQREAAKAGLMISTDWSKPIESLSLAVRPNQVKKARKLAEAKGVPTEFSKDGSPIFRSRQHRAAYCRAMNAIDLQGGYSDATKHDSEYAHLMRLEDEQATKEICETLEGMVCSNEFGNREEIQRYLRRP